jgi:hypothetical protein
VTASGFHGRFAIGAQLIHVVAQAAALLVLILTEFRDVIGTDSTQAAATMPPAPTSLHRLSGLSRLTSLFGLIARMTGSDCTREGENEY